MTSSSPAGSRTLSNYGETDALRPFGFSCDLRIGHDRVVPSAGGAHESVHFGWPPRTAPVFVDSQIGVQDRIDDAPHSGVHPAFATSHASRGNMVQMDVKRVIAAMVAFAFLCGVFSRRHGQVARPDSGNNSVDGS